MTRVLNVYAKLVKRLIFSEQFTQASGTDNQQLARLKFGLSYAMYRWINPLNNLMNLFIHKYRQIKLCLLMCIAFSLPFYLHLPNILIGVAAGITLLRMVCIRSWDLRQWSILSLSFVVYFVLEAIGLLYTAPENYPVGLSALDKHQALILLPFIFSDFAIDSTEGEWIFIAFIFSCLSGVIVCVTVNMYQSITLYDKYFHEWLFSHDRFSEPIRMQAVYFSMYLALAILALVNFYFRGVTVFSKTQKKSHERIEKISIFLLLSVFSIALVTLGSRTNIVSTAAIVLTYLLAYSISKKSYRILWIVAAIPLILIGIIFFNPVVKTRFMDLRHKHEEDSNYGSYFARLDLWRPGIDAIKENLWLGVGTGDHQVELNKKYVMYNYPEGVRLEFNIHNQYLHTLLTHGIPGLSILLLIFGIQIRDGLRNKDWLHIGFISLFMLACLTEATLVRNKGTLFLVFFSFVFPTSNHRQQA